MAAKGSIQFWTRFTVTWGLQKGVITENLHLGAIWECSALIFISVSCRTASCFCAIPKPFAAINVSHMKDIWRLHVSLFWEAPFLTGVHTCVSFFLRAFETLEFQSMCQVPLPWLQRPWGRPEKGDGFLLPQCALGRAKELRACSTAACSTWISVSAYKTEGHWGLQKLLCDTEALPCSPRGFQALSSIPIYINTIYLFCDISSRTRLGAPEQGIRVALTVWQETGKCWEVLFLTNSFIFHRLWDSPVALRKIPEGAHNTIVEAQQVWTSWALLLFSSGTPDKCLWSLGTLFSLLWR